MTIRYKFLNGSDSVYGNHTWRPKKWNQIHGELKICENGFHCSTHIQDALGYVQGDVLAVVEVRGKSAIADDKECWEEMRVIKQVEWSQEQSVQMAVFSAQLVLPIYEAKYPGDDRPREAIEAAEAWLAAPSGAWDAWDAAWAAEAATWAAEAARAAAAGAAEAAWAAAAATWAAEAARAAGAAAAATWAAEAARAAGTDIKTQIHDYAAKIAGVE